LAVFGYGGWFFNSRWVETLGGACAAAAPRLTMGRATHETVNAVTSDFAALVGNLGGISRCGQRTTMCGVAMGANASVPHSPHLGAIKGDSL
jgi:hypothetical protein